MRQICNLSFYHTYPILLLFRKLASSAPVRTRARFACWRHMRDYQIAKQNVESFYAAQQSWDIEEDMKKKRQQAR